MNQALHHHHNDFSSLETVKTLRCLDTFKKIEEDTIEPLPVYQETASKAQQATPDASQLVAAGPSL